MTASKTWICLCPVACVPVGMDNTALAVYDGGAPTNLSGRCQSLHSCTTIRLRTMSPPYSLSHLDFSTFPPRNSLASTDSYARWSSTEHEIASQSLTARVPMDLALGQQLDEDPRHHLYVAQVASDALLGSNASLDLVVDIILSLPRRVYVDARQLPCSRSLCLVVPLLRATIPRLHGAARLHVHRFERPLCLHSMTTPLRRCGLRLRSPLRCQNSGCLLPRLAPRDPRPTLEGASCCELQRAAASSSSRELIFS